MQSLRRRTLAGQLFLVRATPEKFGVLTLDRSIGMQLIYHEFRGVQESSSTAQSLPIQSDVRWRHV
jgi:hypothetical protein